MHHSLYSVARKVSVSPDKKHTIIEFHFCFSSRKFGTKLVLTKINLFALQSDIHNFASKNQLYYNCIFNFLILYFLKCYIVAERLVRETNCRIQLKGIKVSI